MLGQSLRSLPSAAAGLIGSFTLVRERGAATGLLIAALVLILIAGLTVLGWWRFRFRVGAHDIAIERGVLSRQRRIIPFDRVRDVAIERKLLARLIGTARVRIETGGGSGDEGDLEMIALAEAERLREHIRRANRAAPQAADVAEETRAGAAADEPVIYAMDLRRVLTAGVFNFSLLFIALMFGALQYLDDLRLFDLTDWVKAQRGRDLSGAFGVTIVAISAGAVVLLGLATGVLRTLAREYGFRLTVGPQGLRRRRGLLTLSEVLIPARRTEAARIERRWFSGLFGWRSLAFQTLGADAKEGGVQVAAPLARAQEAAIILQHAGFPVAATDGALRPATRALAARCGPYLLAAALVTGVGVLRPPFALLGMIPILFAVGQALRWRNDRHLVGEHALFMTSGLLKRTLWIVPFEKLQTVSLSRGPLQRRLGLATVRLDTAGAPSFGGPRVADLPAPAAEALGGRLLAAFYARRAALRSVTEPSN
jgi:putative membrane protein